MKSEKKRKKIAIIKQGILQYTDAKNKFSLIYFTSSISQQY